MEVYRITLARYANEMVSPGTEGRWNSKGSFLIYTAESRSLACLENLVHRSGIGLSAMFKTIEISIPNSVSILSITEKDLPENWKSMPAQTASRNVGNSWLVSNESAVLKVPSALISNEYNYLLNTAHPLFKKIKIKSVDDFEFDSRFKNN